MDSVGVRELRQNLSVFLRRVVIGESLQVTEHGRPVALLVPLPKRSSVVDKLASAGRLRMRSRGLDAPPRADARADASLSEALMLDREPRR